MHIVFLNTTGSLGGAERVLLTLVEALRILRPSWRFTVVAGGDGPLTDAVGRIGATVELLPFPDALKSLGDWGLPGKTGLALQLARTLPDAVSYRTRLSRKLIALAPDAVHAIGFKMHVMGALACPRRIPLIWHVHDFVSNRAAMKTLLRLCSRRPDAVAAVSDAVTRDLKGVLLDPRQVCTVENAIDLKRFAPADAPGSSQVRIGLIATFARWKGHRVFLEALSLLPSDLSWRACIVGGEVYSRPASQFTETELRDFSAYLGLSAQVTFTPFLEDPAPAFRALDIVVHASTEPEPFGLVIAEGMASGRAVVTSSDAMVTDGVDGLTHRRGDAGDLAHALERLIRDPALRARLGQEADRTAQLRFQPERMARQFLAIYRPVHPETA